MCFGLTGIEINRLERQISLLRSDMAFDDEELDATNTGSPDPEKQVKMDKLKTKLQLLQQKKIERLDKVHPDTLPPQCFS